MKKFAHTLLFSTVLLSGVLHAENLFFNGSFELGKCGYSFDRFYRPKQNPKLAACRT